MTTSSKKSSKNSKRPPLSVPVPQSLPEDDPLMLAVSRLSSAEKDRFFALAEKIHSEKQDTQKPATSPVGHLTRVGHDPNDPFLFESPQRL